jgi:hypothetical protein
MLQNVTKNINYFFETIINSHIELKKVYFFIESNI